MDGLHSRFKKAKDQEVGNAPNLTCALAYARPCCQGKGYAFKAGLMFAQANICDCVLQCHNCRGRSLKVDDFGRARNCVEPAPQMVTNLYNEAKVPTRYFSASLQGFSNYSGNGREVLGFVQNWLEASKQKPLRGFILSGAVGVGKTFLLAALVKALVVRGYSAAFVDFFQLLARLRQAYADDKSDVSLLQPLLEADVLLIDELGKGRNTEWELTILDQLVMGRYNANRPIIASTNFSLEDKPIHWDLNKQLDSDQPMGSGFHDLQFGFLSQRVGPRIYSRLQEMCALVELRGENFRAKSL